MAVKQGADPRRAWCRLTIFRLELKVYDALHGMCVFFSC